MRTTETKIYHIHELSEAARQKAIDRNASWPANHIDWEAAANELEQDYTEVDFNGEVYLYR